MRRSCDSSPCCQLFLSRRQQSEHVRVCQVQRTYLDKMKMTLLLFSTPSRMLVIIVLPAIKSLWWMKSLKPWSISTSRFVLPFAFFFHRVSTSHGTSSWLQGKVTWVTRWCKHPRTYIFLLAVCQNCGSEKMFQHVLSVRKTMIDQNAKETYQKQRNASCSKFSKFSSLSSLGTVSSLK